MKYREFIAAAIFSTASLFSGLAAEQDAPPSAEEFRALLKRVQELEQKLKAFEEAKPSVPPRADKSSQQIQELDEKVKILERNRELDQEAAEAQARQVPKISLGPSGFSFSSADEDFVLKLRGYIQADGRFYVGDSKQAFTDTFLLNRVRPVFEGTVFKDFDFKLMPDFGQGRAVVQDAYLDAHFLPWLSLRAGKFKAPVGLERLQSARDLIFVERALPNDLVPNREIGAALHGEFLKGVLGYEAGVFNGAPDGGSDDADENDSKDVAGRIFVQPFKLSELEPLQGLGVGLAATTGHEDGAAPAYKTIGQQTFFTFNSGTTASGNRNRISPQGYYYWGPFGFLGEYVISSEDISRGALRKRLANTAWQAAASYVLTGEKASYSGVVPKRPFSLSEHHWGAFELAARASQLTVDSDAFNNFGTAARPNTLADRTKSAREATSWGVGLNWYLNRDFKFMLDYDQTRFEGGAAHGNRDAEHAILSRLQVVF
jgi:phosphate-selective porin OprO/OprP